MSAAAPARGLAIYGGSVFLVYLETHGLYSNSPFLGSLPYLVLTALTLFTNIRERVKFPTAASFLFLALGNYLFEAHLLFGIAALFAAFSHVLYMVALLPHLREWSAPFLLLAAVTFFAAFALIFSDVFISIPFLVLLLSSSLLSSVLLVAMAGSFVQFGGCGEMDDSVAMHSLRLVGTVSCFLSMICYIYDLFGRRDPMLIVLKKLFISRKHAEKSMENLSRANPGMNNAECPKLLLQRTFHSVSAIRRKFIDFFEEKDHLHVPSSSVLPNDDDSTLLFTNSGMNQFKSILLGNDKHQLKYVNYQKCIRVGGKHNDLEVVGHDVHHQTFFEMLGNWSFNGSYGKREACTYAWELLTERLALDSTRLYVTYFGGSKEWGLGPDEDCRQVWLDIGIPNDRIIPFTSENFWEMGKVGPCGPCTEIHYDRIGGRQAAELVNRNNSVVELWNIVFMSYSRESDGSLRALPAFHIDTGMGLERLASAVQGVPSNYETDIFEPILIAISKLANITPYRQAVERDPQKAQSYRIVADHLRAISIAIADGANPDTAEAGRLVRLLIRRAMLSGGRLGMPRGALESVIPVVVSTLEDAYPDLASHANWIQGILSKEESWYWKVVDGGREKFEKGKALLPPGASLIPGELLFKLNSQGVPISLCRDLATESNLTLDMKGYQKLLDEKRAAGRDIRFVNQFDVSRKEFPEHSDEAKYRLDVKETAKILALYDRNGRRADRLENGGHIVLDHCQFYAKEGGQSSDLGFLELNGERVKVVDVIKNNGIVLLEVEGGQLNVGESVVQAVDMKRREALMRAHTTTHLLNWALRKYGVGEGQAGSSVYPDRVSFEYVAGENAGERDEVQQVLDLVSDVVTRDYQVQIRNVPLAEAKRLEGLQSEFRKGKEYPPTIRVVSISGAGELPFAMETCCGTHVRRTAEIGELALIRDYSRSKGLRKIIVVMGEELQEARKRAVRAQTELENLLSVRTTRKEIAAFSKKLQTLDIPLNDYLAIRAQLKKLTGGKTYIAAN
ncbi:unnamed protein product, partial [Mesorhabditis spiculigera]